MKISKALILSAILFAATDTVAAENCAVPLTLYLERVDEPTSVVYNNREFHYYTFKDQHQIDCPEGIRKTSECLKRG